MKYDGTNLAAILAAHEAWLYDNSKGERADLRSAKLSYADLRSAKLSYADLSYADLSSAKLSYADLSSAKLSYADLRSAKLRSAKLSYADLSYANLSYANLSYADLSSANLSYADLSYADLSSAKLSYADLSYADLSYADLSSAKLSYADLSSADLRSAKLSSIKQDFLAEVLRLPNELEFLRQSIIDGKIDGSTYSGTCACLAGTLAKSKGITNYNGEAIKNGLVFTADSSSPRERFFLAIKKGDTPKTNGASKIALEWTDEAIAIRDNIRKTMVKA